MSKTIKILWACFLIPLIAGIMMIGYSKTKTEYSTSEYWVAKDYHHVYDKSNGKIVDYISDDEDCSINGNIITVTKTNGALYGWGIAITLIFGFCTITLIFVTDNFISNFVRKIADKLDSYK